MNGKASAALLAGLLGIAGCTHYTLQPEPLTAMPRSQAPALPLRVGLVIDEQRGALTVGNTAEDATLTRTMLENQGYALGPKFAQALRQSGLFQDVRYPQRMTRQALEDVDLILSAQFGYRFVQDPAQGVKIVVTCFTGFITGALFRETSHHIAQGVIAVEDAAGRGVKTYDETIDLTARSMVSIFAEMSTMKKGPPAAADNLIAKLVQSLIDDRALLERSAKAARAAPRQAEPPAAAPEPAVQAAPTEPASAEPAASIPTGPAAPATAAQAAPAPETAAPAPPPAAKPAIAPETYDDQLLP